jgi:hypothetical protein
MKGFAFYAQTYRRPFIMLEGFGPIAIRRSRATPVLRRDSRDA